MCILKCNCGSSPFVDGDNFVSCTNIDCNELDLKYMVGEWNNEMKDSDDLSKLKVAENIYINE